MNLSGIKTAVKPVVNWAVKKSPTILAITGIVGFGGACYLAAKKTPEYVSQRDAMRDVMDMEDVDTKTRVFNEVKLGAKFYWPAATVFATSAACVIGGNSVNLKRNAALMALSTFTETTLQAWKDSAREVVDEKTFNEIREKVNEKRVERTPDVEFIEPPKDGSAVKCLEPISGRYFYSTIETIKHAENVINKRLLVENQLCLNEFYDELGLPHTDGGYMLGWSVSTVRDLMEVGFTYKGDEYGNPIVVLDYEVEPGYDFRDY